jgi:hypothetical protein
VFGGEGSKPLPQERRRDVFRAVVEAQDAGMSVAQSRTAIARRFGLTEGQVRRIEQEGLDGNWPPLAD